MRVLDLDLDFFLAGCCPLAGKGRRPEAEGCQPWTEGEARAFLEEQCGLDRARPVPGRIFETHDRALWFWREQAEAGRLALPFEVTHVDAHSDLGIGHPGPGIVLDGVLPVRPDKRPMLESYVQRKQLDEANYLLFALAMRYVNRLENVRNPMSRPDMPPTLPVPGREDALRLSSFAASLLEGANGPEPEIAYRLYGDYRRFRAKGPYAFVTLACSPRYAPEEADSLIPVIGEYIRII